MEASDQSQRQQITNISGAILLTIRDLRGEGVHQLLRYLPQVADFWGRSHSIIGENIAIFHNPLTSGISFLGGYDVLLPLFYLARKRCLIQGFTMLRSILTIFKIFWEFGWWRFKISKIRRTFRSLWSSLAIIWNHCLLYSLKVVLPSYPKYTNVLVLAIRCDFYGMWAGADFQADHRVLVSRLG